MWSPSRTWVRATWFLSTPSHSETPLFLTGPLKSSLRWALLNPRRPLKATSSNSTTSSRTSFLAKPIPSWTGDTAVSALCVETSYSAELAGPSLQSQLWKPSTRSGSVKMTIFLSNRQLTVSQRLEVVREEILALSTDGQRLTPCPKRKTTLSWISITKIHQLDIIAVRIMRIHQNCKVGTTCYPRMTKPCKLKLLRAQFLPLLRSMTIMDAITGKTTEETFSIVTLRVTQTSTTM